MKKILIVTVMMFAILATSEAQTLQKFFEKYGDDERFQYVSISKGLMNMASVFGGMAKDEKKVMSKMNGLKILTLKDNSGTNLMKTVLQELDQIIESGNFESAVEVREKGERVNIYYRITGQDNADMLIVTKEKNEFNCIWIKGRMTKDELLNTFSSNVNILDDIATM